MKNSEQQKEKFREYQLKLVELFNAAPEGFNLIIISGTVEENNDPEGSLTISAMAAIKGKGRNINPLIRTAMEKDLDLRRILNRAVMFVPHGSEFNNLLEKIFSSK